MLINTNIWALILLPSWFVSLGLEHNSKQLSISLTFRLSSQKVFVNIYVPSVVVGFRFIIIYSRRVFPISTGVWVTTSIHVSRTLFSILSVLNNAVVWMVSTCPPTSKLSRPFNHPFVTITIDIIVTIMFRSFFFSSLARSNYLSFFSHSYSFIL